MSRLALTLRGAAARPLLLLCAALLAGCINLAPDYERPALPVPAQLPPGDDAVAHEAWPAWNTLLHDPRLRELVQQSLANNRDLRSALLNVERSRAQLRIADADRWPTVAAGISATRAPDTQGNEVNVFQAGLQVTAYELDLFGRVRNVSDSAAAQLLASDANSRATRLTLVTQVVSTWLVLAADQEQLALARRTLEGRAQTLKLTELRAQVGAASEIELQGVRGLYAQAQAGAALLERQLAQDGNALVLLVGQPVPANLLPVTGAALDSQALAAVPGQASSDLLLARPDVMQAEQLMIAANANIGAARAAMFPRILLSGSAGVVSDSLSGLVNSGTFAWTLGAQAAMALFDAGRNQANVKVAETTRDIALAQYEKAIQSAFREAADGLVAQATWRDQVTAQAQVAISERERLRLTRMKYEAGTASLIELLDSERTLAAAEQSLVLARLGEMLNRLALYKALGGEETSPH